MSEVCYFAGDHHPERSPSELDRNYMTTNSDNMETVRVWSRLACSRPVVRRGLKYAIVVGAILIAINHGDAILRGELNPLRIAQMGLTVIVPYWVSALSSVGALQEREAGQQLRQISS